MQMQPGQKAFSVATVAAIATLVTACSDKQDLNEGNLTEALNAYYAPGPGICLHSSHYPYALSRGDIRNAADVKNDPILTQVPGLEALKSAGLLISHDAPSPASDGAVARTYTLSDAGSSAFTDLPPAAGSSPNSRVGAFCYGHVHITRVVKWDGPYMGESTAFFNYEMKGLPNWAMRSDIQSAFPTLGRLVRGTGSGTTSSVVMRLTSAGWEVKQGYQQGKRNFLS
ncbi:hypothetical protein [Paraburkholderia sp. WP4_3_2]|uniref:hypothetical protein n=1 Tax=Paraburkholderia sp. WP4_3_2 TaxID=2587162 RepID=UPI001614231B|nr:hypothetical protein [Paraburkholderia sp. WP4_3_2]MBB3261321.1 hypothetical protein [Paraburkholderia sp. WP4_3_2]